MNQLFLYCLGAAVQDTGVRLIAVKLMSNHYHLLLLDPLGLVPKYIERLDYLLTKSVQVLRGWQRRVFDGSGPAYTELLTADAVLNETAYALGNATTAGLVCFSKEWPGARTQVRDIGGRRIVVKRPVGVYSAEDGVMREEVEVRLEMADMVLEKMSIEEARADIAQRVEALEAEAHAEYRKLGWTFRGAEKVKKLSPYARATNYEPRGQLTPRYAGDRRAIAAALEREADLQTRYAATRTKWLSGNRDVVWPAGTYAMKRWHRVSCADPLWDRFGAPGTGTRPS